MAAENNNEKEKGKEFINRMVELLRDDTFYISIKEWKEKSIFRYKNGIFVRDGDTHIKSFLRNQDKYIMPETMNTITRLLMAETYDSFENLDKDINHIVVNNGTLNILTNEFEEHSPTYKSTVRIPIKYDTNAKCPLFLKFLNEILNPEDIPVVFEMIGYCLYKTNVYKKIFYLFGDNDCGKSTFLDFVRYFLGGDKVVSAETIQSLGSPYSQQRSSACLFGKLANLCGEAPTTPIKETAMLKSLSYGDPISADEKFGNKFAFKSFAKLIFASNHMIQFPEEEEEEIMSRMKFIFFPNSIPLEKQDKTLVNKLTSPEEMSGVLNLAIEGLQRMIKNGEMSNYKTKEENIEIYNNFGNSVIRFINERIEKSIQGSFITYDDLQKEYNKFCCDKKVSMLHEKKFFESFKTGIGFNPDMNYRPKINGIQTRAIWGIGWKEITTNEKIVRRVTQITTNEKIVSRVARVSDIAEKVKKDNFTNNFTHPTYAYDYCGSSHYNEICVPDENEPDFRTEADIQSEKDAFEQLDIQSEIADKNIEEIAKKMFPQIYEEIEEYKESDHTQSED